LPPGVNFINLCSASKDTRGGIFSRADYELVPSMTKNTASAHSILPKIGRSISPTKFKPNLCAEICQILFAVCPIFAPKKAARIC